MNVALAFALIGMLAALAYGRKRLLQHRSSESETQFAAASITTIEAAFLCAGPSGVRRLVQAARSAGRALDGTANPAEIETTLADRGFAWSSVVRRAVTIVRIACLVVAFPIVFVLVTSQTPATAHAHSREMAVVVLNYAWIALVIVALTDVGRATPRGRAALARRRRENPLEIVRVADPVETVALYGGNVRPRRASGDTSSDAGDGLVWIGDWSGGGNAHAGAHGASHHGGIDAGGFHGGFDGGLGADGGAGDGGGGSH